jgi:fructokinase
MNSICCFGEVLWDLLPSGKLPGGAPMNVATHLQNLGIQANMISCVGDDDLGQEIKDFLVSKNCTTQYIQSTTIYSTGIVKVTLSEKLDASYEIVQPVAWDFISISDDILHLVENAQALVFGTLACRSSYSFNTLLHLLEKAKLKVFDVNLRQPYFSQEVIEPLLQKADIVKMNDDELKIIGDWYFSDDSERERLEKFAQKFHLKTLIVTQGASGAMLLQEGKYYKSDGFQVKVADTIGSGDSFVAGFLKNYLAGNDAAYSLNYACALGALVATQSGANPKIKEQDIIDLMNIVVV